jgi:hypothetical protein
MYISTSLYGTVTGEFPHYFNIERNQHSSGCSQVDLAAPISMLTSSFETTCRFHRPNARILLFPAGCGRSVHKQFPIGFLSACSISCCPLPSYVLCGILGACNGSITTIYQVILIYTVPNEAKNDERNVSGKSTIFVLTMPGCHFDHVVPSDQSET